jgi:hypothetical protein
MWDSFHNVFFSGLEVFTQFFEVQGIDRCKRERQHVVFIKTHQISAVKVMLDFSRGYLIVDGKY